MLQHHKFTYYTCAVIAVDAIGPGDHVIDGLNAGICCDQVFPFMPLTGVLQTCLMRIAALRVAVWKPDDEGYLWHCLARPLPPLR